MATTFADIIKAHLIGKKLKHRNRYGREVILEVEDIKTNHRSIQITPDTPENDWWGETKDWDETMVCFIDGSEIEITPSTKLNIVDDLIPSAPNLPTPTLMK